MIVADADVLAYFRLGRDAKRSRFSSRARRRDPDWYAPRLWRSEFRNVLRLYLGRGEVRYADALQYAERAEHAMRGREHDVRSRDVPALVARTGRGAYDCGCVALAEALGVALVTGDRGVARRFPETAVLLEDFAG